MNRIVLTTTLVFLLGAMVAADDFVYHGSFLWNDLRAVAAEGDYLIGAFHDGVAIISLDGAERKKDVVFQLAMESPPWRLHLFDTLLAAEREDGRIELIDVSDPLDLTSLGIFEAPPEIHDLELIDTFLYAALGYDGLWRYDISDPTGIEFDDSSTVGINVIALQTVGTHLLALDSYNGILIYEPQAEAIGMPVAQMLLPDPAISFTAARDTVYAAIKPSGYMVGSLADPYHPVYLETRSSFIRADVIKPLPYGLVLFSTYGGFELVEYRFGAPLGHFFPVAGLHGYGDVQNLAGSDFVVLPHDEKGLVGYDVDDPDQVDAEWPDWEYAHPGPIRQLEFVGSRLHVLAPGNGYEIYDLSDPDTPILSGRPANPPYRPVGLAVKADTLLIADEATNAFFQAVDNGWGDPVVLPSFFAVFDSIGRPHMIADYFYDGDLLYFHDKSVVNGSARRVDGADPNRIRWGFQEGVSAALIDGSILFQTGSDNVLHLYRIDAYLELDLISALDLQSATHTLILDDTLLYAGGDDLVTVSLADREFPYSTDRVMGPENIREMRLDYPQLLCVAANGLFIYDISSGKPEFLYGGGAPAVVAGRQNNLLAVSDGYSVKIYALPQTMTDNYVQTTESSCEPHLFGYPNPFNAAIRIELQDFSDCPEVEIYDLLGRRRRTLPVESGTPDRSVTWDGCDRQGRPMPSGIYLVRALGDNRTAVFKAFLVK